MRKASFAPAAASNCRVLILGSLPGERSLAERQYYAHPQNRFWHLVGHTVGEDLASLGYDQRLAALERLHIGLWDVVASARRKGSLDASIREAEHNALSELVESLAGLRAVAFNGRTAAKIGRGLLVGTRLALIDLPSSSPAYAAMPFGEKKNHWEQLRDFLETPRAAAH